MQYHQDDRIVLALDAGGTSFRFFAMAGNAPLGESITLPSHGDNLERCLGNIIDGFSAIKKQCPRPPVAISFAFPAPADYPNGIIGDLVNLPCFRGGVALGPMLEDHFRIPVFLNNDGDLFVYGEAIAGFLPYVNRLLEEAGSHKRYNNLFGVTLGTGFGGGIVRNGILFGGDNSMAGEVWALRNKLHPQMTAEEGASIRAVRRVFAETAGIPFDKAPDPKEIYDIGVGAKPGNREAALEAFRQLGEVVGDAMAEALTLVDGLAVIGGGISGACSLFLPALLKELNSTYTLANGSKLRRLASVAFNLEDQASLVKFLTGEARELTVPRSHRKVRYDPLQRFGVGMTRLGTSPAVGIGAYAFALRQIDHR